MKFGVLFTMAAALLQGGYGGFVSIKMPYLNPAGVTYINDVPSEGHLAYSVPAKVETEHIGYAAAQVPAVAAVPYIKHLPTVSHVPVTKIEAQPAFLEKQLDVIKPAVSTRKFEVRRPAIQKQFFDIEERVVVRPAGSAVVELDQPTSKTQRGPAVIQPLQSQFSNLQASSSLPSLQAYPSLPSFQASPSLSSLQESSLPSPPSLPSPSLPSLPSLPSPSLPSLPSLPPLPSLPSLLSLPSRGIQSSSSSSNEDNETVTIDNPNFRKLNVQSQDRVSAAQTRNGGQSDEPLIARDPSPNVVLSPNSSPDRDQENQNRLLELLTARGNVAEVGFGRLLSQSAIGDAGKIRGRVISATPAPESAEPADERVSTRRVVVSRPIETLQEVNVVEPATKIERVSVQEPTYIKTARLDHVQVHSSVPVVGKALAPTIAHAAVPVYQKTISPAYEYYQ